MQIVDNLYAFKYEDNIIPPTYKCSKCGKEHVKLWRYYQTFVDAQDLFCADCAVEYYKQKNSYESDTEIERKAILNRGEIPIAGVNYPTKEEYEKGLIVDDDGWRWETHYCSNGIFPVRIDQIGWLVPAVPTEENDTFWGYTSVPEDGVLWWRGLSTN